MKIKFSKMHGLGNDFVVFDAISQQLHLGAGEFRQIADRHFGVGCDQILLVEKASSPDADFRYRIFNADGGEVEQCGNGARCFVRYVYEKGLSAKKEFRIETLGGIICPRLEDDGEVSVNMGSPRFAPAKIPFLAEEQALTYQLDLVDHEVEVGVLSMGNPHAVQVVANIDTAPVAKEGPEIESNPRFPKRVNAGFMQVVDRGQIRLRVYERGAGETLACGTGACAAVVSGITRGLLDEKVEVVTRGGNLVISWAGIGQPVWMKGPAVTVFDGEMEIKVSG